MSIKTGGCPEDCGYCPQSARYQTGVQNQQILDIDEIVEKAKIAKARGAGRFCMGAAWRGPKPKDMEKVTAIIRAVKDIGLENVRYFWLTQDGMAEELKDAGLDYYNHNLDTAPENYHNVIGVPSTFTNWLIGTDSGCGSRFAKLAMRPARSLRVSFHAHNTATANFQTSMTHFS